jgi:hypothetical protein
MQVGQGKDEQTITMTEELPAFSSRIKEGKTVGILLRNKALMYEKDKHYCWCQDEMGKLASKGYICEENPKEYEGKLEGKPCFHMIVFVRKG